MMRWSKLGVFAFLMVFFVACSPKVVQLTNKEKENKLKVSDMVNKLDSLNQTKPAYFYGRASTVYHDKKQDFSFKTSIKIKSDSAATALITFAGIPIVNSIVTQDSVKFQNKKEKCYAENSIEFFKDAFGYPFEFENIVQLLLGLPITFEKNNEFTEVQDNVYHILSTQKKIRIKKQTKLYAPEDVTESTITIKYFLVDNGNTLEKVEIENPNEKVKVIVNYGNRSKSPENYNFPQLITAKIITENNKIDVSLSFDNMEINQIQEINYTVPSSYEICK